MKTKPRFCTLILSLVFTASLVQAEEVRLQVKWPAGKKIVKVNDMEMKQKMNMPGMPEGGMEMTMLQSQELTMKISETEGDTKDVEVQITKVKMSMKNPMMNMEYDSESENNDEANPLAGMGAMVDQPFHFVVDANEQIIEVKGLEDLVKSVDPTGAAGNPFSDPETVKGMVQANYISGFDGTPRKVGDTWSAEIDFPLPGLGEMKSEVTYTLVGLEEKDGYNTALLKVAGTFDLSQAPDAKPDPTNPMSNMKVTKGSYTGKMWFSPELGMEIATEMTQDINLEMEMSPEMKMDAQMHMILKNRTESITDL